MKTTAGTPAHRFVQTGHFDEKIGYGIDRPTGNRDWLIIHTLAGAGSVTHRDGRFHVRAHDTLLIAPEVPHGYGTATNPARWELLWAHFQPPPAWLNLLHWPAKSPGVMCLRLEPADARRTIINRIADAHHHASSYARHAQRLALGALEAVFLLCDDLNPNAQHTRIDDRLRTVIDHIPHHLTEDLSVPALAEHANLSPSRFAHLFREQMHTSPQCFVERARLDRAAQLLEHSNLSITRIADLTGFSSPFYLSRRFKHTHGQSPRAYRQQADRR